MKTIRLLLLGSLFLSIFSSNAFSQVEIQNLNYWKFWSGNSPNTLSYKDSVEVISSNEDSTVFSVRQYRINELIGESIFLYKDKKIINTSNRDTVIFDENLKRGDTMRFKFDSYLIDSVLDTVLLDGVSRKMWRMHAIEVFEENDWFFPATWIEGIGEMSQGFKWNSIVSTASIPGIASVCYGDSLILWQSFSFPGGPDPSCDFNYLDTYLGIEDRANKNKDVGFFPNPSSGSLSFAKNLIGYEYKIVDLNGRERSRGTIQNEIDIHNVEPGFYILQIQNDEEHFNYSLVVR